MKESSEVKMTYRAPGSTIKEELRRGCAGVRKENGEFVFVKSEVQMNQELKRKLDEACERFKAALKRSRI